jgi:hypothetical protein
MTWVRGFDQESRAVTQAAFGGRGAAPLPPALREIAGMAPGVYSSLAAIDSIKDTS